MSNAHKYTITARSTGDVLATIEAANEWDARDAYAESIGSFGNDGFPLFRSALFVCSGFRPTERDMECA